MIGTDIVKIERFIESSKSTHFLERIFTPNELCYWHEKGEKPETLAGLFAAKEAVSKALGTGVRGFSPKDIEICHTELGAPVVTLHNMAKRFAAGKTPRVSISHDGGVAIAMAVIYDPGSIH